MISYVLPHGNPQLGDQLVGSKCISHVKSTVDGNGTPFPLTCPVKSKGLSYGNAYDKVYSQQQCILPDQDLFRSVSFSFQHSSKPM